MPDDPHLPGVNFVVTSDAIAAADIDGCLDGSKSVDCDDLNRAFDRASESGAEEARPVFQLFAGLTKYHFSPASRIEPFGPMLIMEGRRTQIPADLLAEQIDALAEAAPTITNHGLRARVSDVVWFRQRKRAGMGFLAVASYCDAIEALEAGTAELAFGLKSPVDPRAVEYIERSCAIANAMRWNRPEFDRLRTMIERLVVVSFEDQDTRGFWRIATIAIDRQVGASGDVAAKAEALAKSKPMMDDPDKRQELWELAARAQHRAKSRDDETRCRLEAAECPVQKAELSIGSPMLRAVLLQQAIALLQSIPGTKERRDTLNAALRETQPAIRDEMKVVSHQIDLIEIADSSMAAVAGRSLPRAIIALFMCDRAPDLDKLRAEVESIRGPASMFSTNVHDHQGRVVFQAPGYGDDPEANEQQLRFEMARNRDFSRHIAVGGVINPIRHLIASEHMVSEDTLMVLFQASPFVPLGHEAIFARAALRLVGGEDMEAASLLVPQLENSLRHVLMLNGIDTTTADNNGIQTEASLTVLITRHREQLEGILGQEVVHEIDMLFTFKGGPALRNDIAHAKLSAGAHWNHNVVWGTWFVIHIALLFVVPRFEDIERAMAESMGFP